MLPLVEGGLTLLNQVVHSLLNQVLLILINLLSLVHLKIQMSLRVPSTQQDSNARKRKSYTALTHRSESSDGTTTIRQQVIHLLVMFDKFTHQLSICSHVHIFYLCSLTEVL